MTPFFLFKLRTYQYALLVLLGSLGLTYYHRTAHFDDAWFAEQSYWLAKDGWVRSEFFRGYNGWEDRIYVFHKLFVYAGALWMSATSFTLAFSKLLTPIFGCLTGFLIWYYNRRQSAEQRWLAVLLYFGCGTLIRYFFVNRPEIMCMSLGFASYVALDRSEGHPTRLGLAGILAGMAALTHLNGLIYLMAGLLWAFIRMGWRSSIWFGIASGITLSLYGLDALLDGNIDRMIMQFLNDPATQAGLKLSDKLSVMLNYHQLFFHSHGEVPLSVLALLCLLIFRRYVRLSQPVLLYLVLLVSIFWVLSKSNFDFYFLLFVPWMVLLVSDYLITYLPLLSPRYQSAGKWLLVGYFIFSLFSVAKVLEENYIEVYIPTYNTQLAQHMPQLHTKIIAPISFFWGQQSNYQIHGLTYYHLMERRYGPIPLSAFFKMADRDSVKYIVSDGFKNASYEIPSSVPERIGAFKRIFQDQYTSIYARQ
ncbi:hypothetical protein EXU85_26010 [Spirosoma sp. KCTC 42546]|uniref:hypothetical protein n=1 Tax=Spirosoma sp. KCTC 42546 TaxID=2520506 RepID=UPI001157B5F2|nr:hypothetical protein [Spirosoma sp. KCTC 42546]QDK81877.1 hypothetical protein EXU85_26010 [Spirosoma sp. KCTC 42546]